jgi:hypothetical protein
VVVFGDLGVWGPMKIKTIVVVGCRDVVCFRPPAWCLVIWVWGRMKSNEIVVGILGCRDFVVLLVDHLQY